MYYYWEQSSDLIKMLVEHDIKRAEIITDSKRNYNTKKYDKYIMLGSGFDTETSRIITPKYDTAYVYHWQFSLGKREYMGRSLKSFDEFFNFILSKIPYDCKILSFVANLGYDYYFCKNHFVKYEVSKHFEKSVRNPLVIEIANKIVFRECLGLFGRSLAQIAEDFCETKKLEGDLDYNLCRLSKTPLSENEIQYCVNDVKILSELGEYVFQNYFGENDSLPLTAISELRNDVKKEMGDRYFEIKTEIQSWMPDDEEDYYLFRQWLFKGGLCGTNSLLMDKHLKNIAHADFDSHYPSCMNHFLYPMGKPIRTSPDNFMSEKKPYIAVIKFSDLRSKTTHSILSSHKAMDLSREKLKNHSSIVIDNGRIWRADEITFCVNDIEFQSICQAYNFDVEKTEIIACWEFEKYGRLPYYLLNVLNREYRRKTKLKIEGKNYTLQYIFAKNKVNGIFGMTCTALYMDEYIIDELGEIMPKRDEVGNRIKRSYQDAIKSVFLSPFWGMWITSYARSLLINFIVKFPNCIVQYDTDSIFFKTNTNESKRLLEYIEKYNTECKELNNEIFDGDTYFSKLGTFELDKYTMSDFKGLGSKRYMYRQFDENKNKYVIKSVVAGCRKGTILEQFKFDSGLEPEENLDKLFNYFKDGLKIDKEHSKKLSSTYIPKGYYDGKDSIDIWYSDYNNNIEKITLESAVVLKPIEFNMGISDIHVRFYKTIQNIYNNMPAEHCKIFEQIMDSFEIEELQDD